MPERIQRQRTKGWRMPDGAVYVGRPTKWGNPFRVGVDGQTRQDAVNNFRQWLQSENPGATEAAVAELAGRDLACWCPPGPCHADVWLELANGPAHPDIPYRCAMCGRTEYRRAIEPGAGTNDESARVAGWRIWPAARGLRTCYCPECAGTERAYWERRQYQGVPSEWIER